MEGWMILKLNRIVVVQSLSCVRPFATSRTAAHQASLSFTISQSMLKFMSIKLMMPSNHLILCQPLLLPSILPSIRVFSNESVLCIRLLSHFSHVPLFATPWTIGCQAPLSIEIFQVRILKWVAMPSSSRSSRPRS